MGLCIFYNSIFSKVSSISSYSWMAYHVSHITWVQVRNIGVAIVVFDSILGLSILSIKKVYKICCIYFSCSLGYIFCILYINSQIFKSVSALEVIWSLRFDLLMTHLDIIRFFFICSGISFH